MSFLRLRKFTGRRVVKLAIRGKEGKSAGRKKGNMNDNMAQQGTVIRLEGNQNWNIWKFQTTILLRSQNLYNVVTESKKPSSQEERAVWEKQDVKAQTLLVTRMSESVMLHVISCTTSSEMWRKLLSIYEQKSETSIHIKQQRFFQLKFDENTEMSVFLSKVQEMHNELRQLGENISDKFVITKVMMSLPDDYKHFISAWESAPDDKQTIENLCARLLVEEERLKEKGQTSTSSRSSSSAFFAKKTFKRDIQCYKCKKLGHYQSECKFNKMNNRENRNSVSSANDNKCFYCGKPGHTKLQCRYRKNKESNAFTASGQSDCFETYEHSKWLVDSGASEHMCCDKDLFTSLTSLKNKLVVLGDGNHISALGVGQMAVQVFNGNCWIDTTIDNVLYVPELKTNLLSVKCVTAKGYVMVTEENYCKFYKNKKVCAIAERAGNLYYLNFMYKQNIVNVAESKQSGQSNKVSLMEWHQRLAHQNMVYVKDILKNNNIKVTDTSVNESCESCLSGKIHRLPFPNSENKSTKTCELIHADVCGPMEEYSVGGSRYFVIFKDDYSMYRYVYFIRGKYEVKDCIENFINKAENETGNKVKYFRSDNGLEFLNKDVERIFHKRGIIHQLTVPYTPQQNGKAERENRTLVEAARTMLYSQKLPKTLWAEAVNMAAYVLNRSGKSSVEKKSPYNLWTNRDFDLHTLKVFGSPVIAHIPDEKRKKWDAKGENGIMVGFSENTKGYRIYFPQKNKVEIKRDVVFISMKNYQENEEIVKQNIENIIPEEINNETEDNIDETNTGNDSHISQDMSDDSEYVPCQEDESKSDDYTLSQVSESSILTSPEISPRTQRVRKQTSFYKCNHVDLLDEEPKTYEEAMIREDAGMWTVAINKEILKKIEKGDFEKI